MRDEDVVIKTERHGSERLLVWNVVAMVLVPSLLFSGHSALSVGLFIALGILAPINVVVYKRVWLDAPRFNTQKYFLALVPYLISLGIVCVGVASPSVTVEMMDGMEYFVLNTDNPSLITSSAISGTHAILGELEILAAAACAAQLGIDLETIAKGLESVRSVEGRLERVASYRGAEIFVDFAHTPDGLEKSLGALDAHRSGKLICLFGCGGNRDKGKRELMGEVAGQLCDFCVFTSDNPRYEDPYDIIMEIETGCRRYSKNYVTVQDRAIATE